MTERTVDWVVQRGRVAARGTTGNDGAARYDDAALFLSALGVSAWLLDEDLAVRTMTAAAEPFARAHSQGRRLQDFRFPLDDARVLRDAARVRTDRVSIDRELRSQAGTWYLVRLRPYPNAEGPGGVVVTLVDVASLRAVEQKVQSAVARRDDFLAALSHELRNPLGAIVAAATLAQDGGEASERALEIIESQSKQMSRLIDDLLDISRVNRDKLQLNRESTDVRDCVVHALESVAPLGRERHVAVHSELSATPLYADGDPTRLQQVASNLLSNAIKYNRAGGEVWVSAVREGGDIVIRVRDDGIGISEELVESVFEPFVQLESGRSRADGGMGVGLTLVRTIVELHGGQVRVHSHGADCGTEFTVRLPAVESPPSRPNAVAPSAADAHARILLVEDSDDNRAMLRALLERDGHHVESAADGGAALALYIDGRFDLALIDIGLPTMDGYELARRIRAHGRAIRLIALTGYGRAADQLAAAEAGFDDHIIKPVSMDALRAVFHRMP